MDRGVAVLKVTRRELDLYNRAVEEGGHFGAMYNIASLLEADCRVEIRDMQRAAEFYTQASRSENCLDSLMRLRFFTRGEHVEWNQTLSFL